MNEIQQTLDQLLNCYRQLFGNDNSIVVGKTPKDFRDALPDAPGVYIVSTIAGVVIYVGSTGKIENKEGAGIRWGKGTLKKRSERWTPYFFNDENNSFMYGPRNGKREQRYAEGAFANCIPLSEIRVEYFKFNKEKLSAPSALEHLLIQGHLNQYGCLPPANQAI